MLQMMTSREDAAMMNAGSVQIQAIVPLECVSKWKEMQFRMDLTAFQGAFRGAASQIFDL